MAKNLVIVESPAKAKTLKKFLGSTYKIEASVGHVRDLPKSELGINIENDFEPKYITIRGKGEILSKLRKEVKAADKIYLATDPDREGEAISWHLLHALKLDDKKASRITFNEITKNAVKRSIKEARKIDMNLVDAQQARREVDRIVGYQLSPLLWKKVKKGLSAGRVQSVTLKLICDREEEIKNFIEEEYWTLDADLEASANGSKPEKTVAKLAISDTIKTKAELDKIMDECREQAFTVREVKKGARTKKPIPPFTTSTMQQEASKLYNFATHKTMMVAQQLYEGVDIIGEGTLGLVTYIRTDSVRISDEAYEEAKVYITERFGENYCAAEKPVYKSRGRTQDAHEAIRPTEITRTPDSVKASLTKEQYKLYKLIWERFMASQMSSAQYDTMSVKIECGQHIFRVSGSVLKFDGYLKIYNPTEEGEESGADIKIPVLEAGQVLKLVELLPEQHFTQPPPRFTEANLVKTMEELGIGRPSTYASTITNILARGYVSRENKVFYSTELGEIVNDIMKNNFEDIVDVEFTAKMEKELDAVEDGGIEWKQIVRSFYTPFHEKLKLAEEKIGEIDVGDEETDVICENCGRNMVIKYGRFGKFLACPSFPECKNAKPYFEDTGVKCPLCSGKVFIKKTKKGRKYFGCEHNPECAFMSWNMPTGEKCPVCGEFLVEKGGKERKIVCSSGTCGYNVLKEVVD